MPSQPPNVIILTSGISGSSVLAGLIARAGYWTGPATHKKVNEYDTFENVDLIQMNLRLFEQAGYTGNYTMEFSSEAIRHIACLRHRIPEAPFRRFLQTCDEHRPWIWKDPRLWLTFCFWQRLLDPEACRFILLTRDYKNAWVSSLIRRHIRSYGSLKRYEQSIRDSLVGVLNGNGFPYLHMTFEKLVVEPEESIRRLNAFLGTNLGVADLAAIYHKPLYNAPRSSLADYIKASLIYIKNYSERFDLIEKGS